MKDPAVSPERRYRPRDEKISMDKHEGKNHVKILHKPTGASVEGVGDDLDALLEELRDQLDNEVASLDEARGRLGDSKD